jgi:hypothetical protein
MEKHLFDLFMFGLILVVIYYVFSNLNINNMREGLTNNDITTSTTTTSATSIPSATTNGIAGNAASYAASIKNMATLSKDKLLITKYRTDYENTIMSYDDYVNSLMLEILLDGSTDQMKKLSDIATLNQSKIALNAIMKYVDSQ